MSDLTGTLAVLDRWVYVRLGRRPFSEVGCARQLGALLGTRLRRNTVRTLTVRHSLPGRRRKWIRILLVRRADTERWYELRVSDHDQVARVYRAVVLYADEQEPSRVLNLLLHDQDSTDLPAPGRAWVSIGESRPIPRVTRARLEKQFCE